MNKNRNLITLIAAAMAASVIIPNKKLPKVIQDICNVLNTMNPLKAFYELLKTSMNEFDALYSLQPGDHIYCKRSLGYSHHGIYAGKGQVYAYQYAGMHNSSKIVKCTLHEFADGDYINKLNYESDFDIPTILARAESRLNETAYNVINNNCMHYAYWCRLSDGIEYNNTKNVFDMLLSYL